VHDDKKQPTNATRNNIILRRSYQEEEFIRKKTQNTILLATLNNCADADNFVSVPPEYKYYYKTCYQLSRLKYALKIYSHFPAC
jgi:hypothetical protein